MEELELLEVEEVEELEVVEVVVPPSVYSCLINVAPRPHLTVTVLPVEV